MTKYEEGHQIMYNEIYLKTNEDLCRLILRVEDRLCEFINESE